jgi:dynein heavy chain
VQPRDSGGGAGQTPDEVVAELATEFEKMLPKAMDEEDEAGPDTFVMRGEYMDSLATALKQEIVRYNRIIFKMEATLLDIQRAIRGEVLMSAELDEQYTAMLNNQVPANWANVAYPSLKPLASWMADLIARLTFMRTWLVNGPPIVFWFGGFYFPQGFLTGTQQNHARKYKLPIDSLSYAFAITDEEKAESVTEAPDDGVMCTGMYFDGARWDYERKALCDPRPAENFTLLPVTHFMPTPNYKPSVNNYECPCYKTSTRSGALSTTGMSTNYVLNVELPVLEEDTPEQWVLAGVALLTNLND